MGETRVDLLHLLEDLRDAYPGALEETILTEIVANSLDSGADRIGVACDAGAATLTVVDNGSGMQRRELARYHDVAATSKLRGQGIGFAGVGIKLALLLCEDVVTETKRGKTHVSTRWRLSSRHKAPWKWEPPAGLVVERGTAVRMRLSGPLSPLLDPGFIEGALHRHYRPLFERFFRSILADQYPAPICFEINGTGVGVEPPATIDIAEFEVKLPRRRKPSALGYLQRGPAPFPEEMRGLAISTLGKIIKRGWDWLAITPKAPECIGGIVEVPALAECLTLNKGDFIRSGTRGATFLAYRKGIQEVVSRQLAAWGDSRDALDESRRRAARPVERDLERVLVDLADQFPLVATLVERREGGQRRLPIGVPNEDRGPIGIFSSVRPEREAELTSTGRDAEPGLAMAATPELLDEARPRSGAQAEQHASIVLPGAEGRRRPARYGLEIKFEQRGGEPELGRLVESTVWINETHPAYLRSVASRSEGYHIALCVAMALAPLAVEPSRERAFIMAFLEHWGRVLRRTSRARSRR